MLKVKKITVTSYFHNGAKNYFLKFCKKYFLKYCQLWRVITPLNFIFK